MIPDFQGRSVSGSDGQASARFGISAGDTAHIMTILRSTLYSDKVLAVLREYGANAWDANRMAGRGDKPIEVKLPTSMEPRLEIIDSGPGLSHDDVFRVFSQYGASTKRGTDDAVGYMGIGSKSGFAYSDSFMIISRHGGMRRTYVAVLDASEEGEIRLMAEEPWDEADTGVTIQVGVKSDDIWEFNAKAAEVFRFYVPRPIINTNLPPVVSESTVIPGQEGWIAVMGPVGYPINMTKLEVQKYIARSGGVVFFPIGALTVDASREGLRYTDVTKKNLIDGLNAALDKYVESFTSTLVGMVAWDKRLRLQGMGLFGQLLGATAFKGAYEDNVDIKELKTKGIKIGFTSIKVSKDTRFVLVDDRRSIKGFHLVDKQDYLVRRAADATVADAEKGLRALIKDAKIEGITVVRTSELPWERPTKASQSVKHRVSAFEFKGADNMVSGGKGYNALSTMWEPVDREEQDDDVYVVMEAFRTDFYDEFRRDRRILSMFGLTPKVYGYKKSNREGATNEHLGQTYSEWRNDLYDMVRAKWPGLDDLIDAIQFRNYSHWNVKVFDRLVDATDANHPLGEFARMIRDGVALLKGAGEGKVDVAQTLASRMHKPMRATEGELKKLTKKYPLIERFEVFLMDGWGHWLDYVRGQDALAAAQKAARKAAKEEVSDAVAA